MYLYVNASLSVLGGKCHLKECCQGLKNLLKCKYFPCYYTGLKLRLIFWRLQAAQGANGGPVVAAISFREDKERSILNNLYLVFFFQEDWKEIKNSQVWRLNLDWLFLPEICEMYFSRVRNLGPEPKLMFVTSRMILFTHCSALFTAVPAREGALLATGPELLRVDPFFFPNRTFVFTGWMNNAGPTFFWGGGGEVKL